MTFRRIAKSLLCITLFFMIVLIATIVLFSTVWSTSCKCSTTCERTSSFIKHWTEDTSDLEPDESWADIAEELYPFFTPPPRAPGLLGKETTKRKCVNNAPPVGFVFQKPKQNKEFIYNGIAVVLVRKWVLMWSKRLNDTYSNTSLIFVRVNSKYLSKGGEVIRVLRVVHFKQLVALYLEHPISTDCIEFASLCTDDIEINTYIIFTTMWPGYKKAYEFRELRNITQYKNSTKVAYSIPLFIKPHNTYLLFGWRRSSSETNEDFIFHNDKGIYRKWLESL